ncbi:hypothetical protein [Spirosoma utsteinense]|uniref:AlgX/AlgJ SGNH hydrolase-like domain-containing protein n=1 Tax=Spirosoma utsteinense TaxID=2585773 RepID=A0ABR6W6Z1_9BACT|nr:hypothetical protein [Spirosoma utsteinense]MBC3785564.1 hypothetical protein [Spirosoma utsteinense]MBC3791712.1 hypothetical protein [Spirosoma utsteinense]
MRFLRYAVLSLTLVLWAGGLSTTVSRWLYKAGVIVDDYRFGDLYRLSALPQFKEPAPQCGSSSLASDTASTHLYIIGDSFSEEQRLGQGDFPVSHYQRVAWDHRQRAQLDSTKRNILILESVERHVREHFSIPVTELTVDADTLKTPAQRLSLRKRLSSEFHLSDVEERLESTLFSQDWAFWFKELKARLTFDWFDRVSTGVSVSKNGQHLFLRSDTDTAKKLNSSFAPLTDRDVNTLVDSINVVADQYKRRGFDDVYLSIIPNKASILETGRTDYNRLVERVQRSPALRVKTIDVFSKFQQTRPSPYLLSDTHWNCTGRAIWLDQVRKTAGL